MTTILHILRKDVRHLWPHASAVFILMAISAILDPTYANRGPSFSFSLLSGFALPLACWNLIIAAIHEEKLPGDRQFWVTRPYPWKQLLAAKGLFLAIFLNIPLALWHTAAYMAVGIPVWQHLPALVWRQFFFSAIFILPVAAVAALTSSLGQVVLAALAILLPLGIMETFLFGRFRINWMRVEGYFITAIAVMVVAGVGMILVVQYSRRNTRLARTLAGALAVLILAVAFAAGQVSGGSLHYENSAIRVSLDEQSSGHSTIVPSGGRDIVTLDIPLRVTGIPEGIDLVQNSIQFSLDGSQGHTWHSQLVADGGFHDLTSGTGWFTIFVPAQTLTWLEPQPVTARGSAHFLAFGRRQLFPLPHEHSIVVPKVGVCSSGRDSLGKVSLFCYTPDPRASVAIGNSRGRLNWIIPQGLVDTSIPTSFDFQPLGKFTSLLSYQSWDEIGAAQLMTAEVPPPVEVRFELPAVDLSQYVVAR
ncbi:MAG TPA: hypothetical protein VKU19_39890 [Bryobacteraceae bacterium]|nr:hypothetical protein [Bryobacteraceae bacterium]